MKNESRITLIKEKIEKSLKPSYFEVTDDSQAHAGHAGSASGKGHFTIKIASPLFSGKSLVEQHRLVYAALGQLMTTDIHALRIICLSK